MFGFEQVILYGAGVITTMLLGLISKKISKKSLSQKSVKQLEKPKQKELASINIEDKLENTRKQQLLRHIRNQENYPALNMIFSISNNVATHPSTLKFSMEKSLNEAMSQYRFHVDKMVKLYNHPKLSAEKYYQIPREAVSTIISFVSAVTDKSLGAYATNNIELSLIFDLNDSRKLQETIEKDYQEILRQEKSDKDAESIRNQKMELFDKMEELYKNIVNKYSEAYFFELPSHVEGFLADREKADSLRVSDITKNFERILKTIETLDNPQHKVLKDFHHDKRLVKKLMEVNPSSLEIIQLQEAIGTIMHREDWGTNPHAEMVKVRKEWDKLVLNTLGKTTVELKKEILNIYY